MKRGRWTHALLGLALAAIMPLTARTLRAGGGEGLGEALDGNPVRALLARVEMLEEKTAVLEGKVTALEADKVALVAALAAEASAREGADALLQDQLDGLDNVARLEQYLTVTEPGTTLQGLPGPHVIFEDVNVHIRNNTDDTEGYSASWLLDGLGNLVLGYNEDWSGFTRDTSHSLVVGTDHGYYGTGVIVSGYQNQALNWGACVIGGWQNQATGWMATLIGGNLNAATGGDSTVSGGYRNVASGSHASVSGGSQNRATEQESWVGGGNSNTAGGYRSAIGGGLSNDALGNYSFVGGGRDNIANGGQSVVSGGRDRSTTGTYQWVGGGYSSPQ